MLPLEKLYHSWFFTLSQLKEGEILFHEWDIDAHIYVVYDGELIVEKHNTLSSQIKVLWNIRIWGIVGESSLENQERKKTVQIRALRNTSLLKIDAQNGISNMLENSPEIAIIFLKSIIHMGHFRLEKANREITINHEVSLAITEISEINQKSIQNLLEKIQILLWVEQIIYIEKNLVMDDYFKLSFDSLEGASNKIIKFEWSKFEYNTLIKEGVKIAQNIIHAPLQLWENLMGYIVIWNESKDFVENDERLLHDIAISLVWVMKQKEIINEEKNKAFARGII